MYSKTKLKGTHTRWGFLYGALYTQQLGGLVVGNSSCYLVVVVSYACGAPPNDTHQWPVDAHV